MSADEESTQEEQCAALFAAHEEAIKSGQTTATIPAAPAELQQRLEQDLACAQLLHQALRLPTAPEPMANTKPPLPDPQAVRVQLDLPGKAGPESADQIQALLRKRLRFISLVVLAIYGYLITFSVIKIVGDPDRHGQYLPFLAPYLLVVAVVVVSSVFLWTSRALCLRQLRGIELTLFGLLLALQSFGFATDLFGTPQFLAGEKWMGTSKNDGTFLWFHSANQSLSSLILIVTYATLIPSSWKRCTLVVGVMAATPLIIAATACITVVDSPSTFLSHYIPPMAISLAIAVAIAAYGTHRIELLRREVAQARKLGQYQLQQRLGAGGMGEVYLASHALLRRPAAIKLIRPERAGDPANLARFEREVQATATLTHPNTVQIFDYGHAEDGTFYYAMEYLPGTNLDDLVKQRGPLPPERVIHLVRQVCGALHEAHAIGLIHRDIKPSNIITCQRGGLHDVAKLLDFGLVRSQRLAADGDHITQDGAVAGTPAYMSPEQADGNTELDSRTDIYSLGAVAYYLLTGKPPFVRTNPLRVLVAHLSDPPTPPSQLRADVPADLEAVVLKCLEKDPAQRFPDARSLDRALASCQAFGLWTEERAGA